ncbi:uncharacterized protein MELLADRAFT_103750 [Melampsora larici-populina 98AG31]|uniref:Uncharacterized protein n=1 Tax=Melampsora larici-populina (strain 98AG31 / pathotype 3-4-7) TaxID=747676 RepID=F4RC94_MELLP|nr:uncharacterized protein MELLADRAFT_103750 [Melampsora larici-populina 98AG31]EGG09701.1 hypothetical protein MELLADRAFT_103750 [Melampsora larici-populina 98AG31]
MTNAANATPTTNEPSETAGPSATVNQAEAPPTAVSQDPKPLMGAEPERPAPNAQATAEVLVLVTPAGGQLETVVKEDLDGVAILELELRSKTNDSTWDPQSHMSKGKGKREDTPTEEESSLHSDDMELCYATPPCPVTQPARIRQAPSHVDCVMMLQAKVQEVSVFQNYAEGTALFAHLTELAASKPVANQAQSKHRNNDNHPCATSNQPSPHWLIQENLSEFSLETRNGPIKTWYSPPN